MEITRLPIGDPAPTDVDCLRIEELAGGTFQLTASALCTGQDVAESVSIVDGPLFQSVQEAEEAGLVWAEDVGAEQLYITVGTLAQPLKSTEIDLPL